MSIEAMRLALEALEKATPVKAKDPQMQADAIVALRQAIEQAEQAQPVAWRITDGEGDWEYRTELPEQWSIAWSSRYGRKYEPLYTTPPQRQPLTDEEIEDLYFDKFSISELKAFARAIEAAHGIRARGNVNDGLHK